jgi:tRNA dimethylallyltransferase
VARHQAREETPHQSRKPKAVLIAGPTASGKSAAALELASRLGGTIINADSMQVYRELAVLTARPTEAEQREVPHRLYATVGAPEAYSVGRWLTDAGNAIDEAEQQGGLPILVGGTGLYFKALTEGLAPVPDIPAEIRNHWRERAEALGRDKLYRELVEHDPGMAARLRNGDTQRLVRALEVIDATGVSLAEWQGTNAAPRLDPSSVLRLVIAPEREPLYAAIDARFDTMIEQGAIDEVQRLLDRHLDPGLPAMRAHGVRELASYLAGASSRDEAVNKAKIESRRYAKRQMTWARRFMADWEWFPDTDSAVTALAATP